MSFWDDIKKFAQPYGDEDEYDDYDDEDMDDGYEEEEESAPRFTSRRESVSDDTFASTASTAAPFASTSGSVAGSGFSGTVINSNSSSGKQQVILTRPESFNDAPEIANNLRAKKAIVLNLEGVDKGLARRVVDFLSGCTFAVDGSVKKISQATYLFCPYNMEVLGDLKNLQSEVENYI